MSGHMFEDCQGSHVVLGGRSGTEMGAGGQRGVLQKSRGRRVAREVVEEAGRGDLRSILAI